MLNRTGKHGAVIYNPDSTMHALVDLALRTAPAIRNIRLESRLGYSLSGLHSVQTGVAGSPTLSIGDSYAPIKNTLVIGTQTTTNQTPTSDLTVVGSISAASIQINSVNVATEGTTSLSRY